MSKKPYRMGTTASDSPLQGEGVLPGSAAAKPRADAQWSSVIRVSLKWRSKLSSTLKTLRAASSEECRKSDSEPRSPIPSPRRSRRSRRSRCRPAAGPPWRAGAGACGRDPSRASRRVADPLPMSSCGRSDRPRHGARPALRRRRSLQISARRRHARHRAHGIRARWDFLISWAVTTPRRGSPRCATRSGRARAPRRHRAATCWAPIRLRLLERERPRSARGGPPPASISSLWFRGRGINDAGACLR